MLSSVSHGRSIASGSSAHGGCVTWHRAESPYGTCARPSAPEFAHWQRIRLPDVALVDAVLMEILSDFGCDCLQVATAHVWCGHAIHRHLRRRHRYLDSGHA